MQSDKELVYGWCDVCDKRGYVKEYKLRTGKVVRLCLNCVTTGYEQLRHKKPHGTTRDQAEGDKPHQPFRYTQVD